MKHHPNAFTPQLRRHRTSLMIGLVGGLLLIGLIVLMNRGHRTKPPRSDGPVPAGVAKVELRDMPLWQSGVGSVQPLEMVDVKPRVDGQIVEILLREGQEVRAGQPLARIDPRPFAARVAQAVAARARDRAQLANAQLELTRSSKLLSLGVATGRSVDALKAQVAALAATVAADDAELATARLDLDWTVVRSPIAGRVGLRQLNKGATVRTSDPTGIVTITQTSPIAVIFSLTQDALPALAAAGQATVVVADQSGTRDLARGRLGTIDSQVDGANGQVKLKAIFDNRDHALWPGTLVTARILVGALHHTPTVPDSAIQSSQQGVSVYVVKPDSTVVARPVKAGPSVAGRTAILAGLRGGETVVTSGQSRIADGTRIAARAEAPAR